MFRVTHFEIPSENPEAAMSFYKNVFGWQFNQYGDFEYWLTITGSDDKPGINGGLMKKNHPKQPVTNVIDVDDLDSTLSAIIQNGGEILVEKHALPGLGWLAYFRDLDQNIFGVMQPDETAD